MTRPRAVFDCNIFIQAIAFEDGPAGQALRMVEGGRVELLSSKAILRELRRVIHYEEVRAISPNLTPVRVEGLLRRLAYRSSLVRRVRHLFDYPRDPDDEPYLDLCATSHADWLVTRDNDLLSLMTSHSAFAKRFRQITHPLWIVDPIRFLVAIEHTIE